MATLAMNPAVRQPFASLDTGRLHSLLTARMNLANQQHHHSGDTMAWKTCTMASHNAENIDPAGLNASTKRKRSADDEDTAADAAAAAAAAKNLAKTFKSSRLGGTQISIPSNVSSVSPAPGGVVARQRPSTPKASASCLRPAGRSPQSKACKAFGRRSTVSKSKPESSAARRRSAGGVLRPFSIAAAFSSSEIPRTTHIQPSLKPSCFFEIYEDSEEDEMTNLMQHSTCVLDISDDEGKSRSECRGKENIPPAELGITLASGVAVEPAGASVIDKTSTKMSDKRPDDAESRTPLGELNAAEFYPAGCHAFSYAVVYDDDNENDGNDQAGLAAGKLAAGKDGAQRRAAPASFSAVPASGQLTREAREAKTTPGYSSIASLLALALPAKSAENLAPVPAADHPSGDHIDIWESESAAEEGCYP